MYEDVVIVFDAKEFVLAWDRLHLQTHVDNFKYHYYNEHYNVNINTGSNDHFDGAPQFDAPVKFQT